MSALPSSSSAVHPTARQHGSSVNASFFGRRRTIIDQPGPAHLLHHYKNNAFGRSPETRLGGALRYWRRISNGGCDTTQPGRGSGSCPISKRTHEGKTLTPTTRRRRGGGRIETHREDAEGLISHAGDGGKRSTCCTAPAVCRCAVVVGWD